MLKDEKKSKKQLIDEVQMLRRQAQNLKVEEKVCEDDLKGTEIQYRRLFESTQDGIFILDGDTCKIRDANPSIMDMLGYSWEEIAGKCLWEIGSFIDTQKCIMAHEEVQKKDYVCFENLTLETKNGQSIEVDFISNAYRINHHRVIQCNIRNITERRRLEREVRLIATHDTLTGLPNRTLFMDRVHMALMHAHRKKKKVAVMSLDLDKFNTVNNSLGNHVGDGLLRAAADRLTGTLRRSDTVARVGGDEFSVVLPEIDDVEHVAVVARKILEQFRQQFIINGRRIIVTISIGIATYPEDGRDAETLMNNADKAMYHVRSNGFDNYKLFGS